MNQLPFERAKNEYEKHLLPIDEEICALVKKRKELSNDNPNFPSEKTIADLAENYGLYEDLVSALFGTMQMGEYFKPRVEPTGFRKHLPVLQSLEIDDHLYSVTFIRQYENASVLNLTVDWDGFRDVTHASEHPDFELFIDESYDCRMDNGSGSTGYFRTTYIISPPLPDDFTGIDLTFTEYSDLVRKKPTGAQFVIHLT